MLRKLACLLLSAGLLACVDPVDPTPTSEAAGLYWLVSVNDKSTPAIRTEDASVRITVMNGSAFLGSDGSFSERFVTMTAYANGDWKQDTVITRGTFGVKGTELTVAVGPNRSDPASSFTGGLGVMEMTYARGGVTYRYVKDPNW